MDGEIVLRTRPHSSGWRLLIGRYKRLLRKVGLVYCLYLFCFKELMDFVGCWLVLKCTSLNMLIRSHEHSSIASSCAWLPLNMFYEVHLTPISNQQNPLILQNSKGIGSRPDLFWRSSCNLQTIRKKDLVHETIGEKLCDSHHTYTS